MTWLDFYLFGMVISFAIIYSRYNRTIEILGYHPGMDKFLILGLLSWFFILYYIVPRRED